MPWVHADQQLGRRPEAGSKGSELGMDSPVPSRESAGASLGFAEEERAGSGVPSWTNLSGHFLCSPHHGSEVEFWSCDLFRGVLCRPILRGWRLRTSKQDPGPGLMSGVRHCPLAPFQGALWPYLNLSETIDKFPPPSLDSPHSACHLQ